MLFTHTNYVDILTDEYETRKANNSQYSLRAFSRDLKIAPSRLSEILKGKQGLSGKKASEMADLLNYNAMEKDFFTCLVESKHARSKIAKDSAIIRLRKFSYTSEQNKSLNVFKVISDWEHLALLELLLLKNARQSVKWISGKLGITEAKTKTVIKRLLDVGLIEKKGTKLKRVSKDYFIWPTEIPSASIKHYHNQVINKAIESLYTTPLDQREFNTVVMAIDTDKLPEAKKLMSKFNKEIFKLLSNKKTSSRIYYYSSQLFPADQY